MVDYVSWLASLASPELGTAQPQLVSFSFSQRLVNIFSYSFQTHILIPLHVKKIFHIQSIPLISSFLSHIYNLEDCLRPDMGLGYETGQLIILY